MANVKVSQCLWKHSCLHSDVENMTWSCKHDVPQADTFSMKCYIVANSHRGLPRLNAIIIMPQL